MKKRVAELVVAAIISSDGEAEIYEDYSGRGMFGKTTTAVVTDLSSELVVKSIMVDGYSFEDEGFDLDEVTDFKGDSLGLSNIYY